MLVVTVPMPPPLPWSQSTQTLNLGCPFATSLYLQIPRGHRVVPMRAWPMQGRVPAVRRARVRGGPPRLDVRGVCGGLGAAGSALFPLRRRRRPRGPGHDCVGATDGGAGHRGLHVHAVHSTERLYASQATGALSPSLFCVGFECFEACWDTRTVPSLLRRGFRPRLISIGKLTGNASTY